MTTRWPVVLNPKPFESLSSWLERHASYYKIALDTLFHSGLNINSPKNIIQIDLKPDIKILRNISTFTGFPLEALRKMTLESLSPTILDFTDVHSKYDFESYIQTFHFFMRKEEKDLSVRNSRIPCKIIPWLRETPWSSYKPMERFCPVCLEIKESYKLLVWRLCVFSSCLKHRCYLIERPIIKKLIFKNKLEIKEEPSLPIKKAKNSVLAIDKMTFQALTQGNVTFDNGETMQAAIWFRFLRSLIREISTRVNLTQSSQNILKNLLNNSNKEPVLTTPFELLKQDERIITMTIAGLLLKRWPQNIIAKILEKSTIFLYKFKHDIPFALGKYFDCYLGDCQAELDNPEFVVRLNELRKQGCWDEIRYEDRINGANEFLHTSHT